MTVRDERAAALTRWHRDMGDHFAAVLPRVLDDLEAIDGRHAADVELDIAIDEERAKQAAATEQPAVPVKPAPRRRTTR